MKCPFFIKLLGDFGLCNATPRRCGGELENSPSVGSIYREYLCGRTGMIIRAQDRRDPMDDRTETSYQVVGYIGKEGRK